MFNVINVNHFGEYEQRKKFRNFDHSSNHFYHVTWVKNKSLLTIGCRAGVSTFWKKCKRKRTNERTKEKTAYVFTHNVIECEIKSLFNFFFVFLNHVKFKWTSQVRCDFWHFLYESTTMNWNDYLVSLHRRDEWIKKKIIYRQFY